MSAEATTVTARRPDPRRWWGVALVVALVAAMGVAAAVLLSAGGRGARPFPGEPLEWTTHELEVATAEDVSSQMGGFGLPEIQAGDEYVTWLAGLSELSGPPVDIAVDQGSDDVWALVLLTLEEKNLLYHLDASGEVATYDLGGRGGTGLAAHLEMAGNRVAVALDDRLLVVDAASENYREARLPRVPRRPDTIVDASVGPTGMRAADDSLFVHWDHRSAALEVSLVEDEVRTIPVPESESFSAVDEVVVSESYIWFLQTLDISGGEQAHVAWLNRKSGELLGTAPVKPHTAAADGDELIVPSWGPFGLHRVSAGGFSAIGLDERGTEYVENRLGPATITVVDAGRGAAWIVNPTAQAVLRVNIDTGISEEYRLPAYETETFSCPWDTACPATMTVMTDVPAIALAENGDLYFADSTAFRVGKIPAQ